MDQARSKHGPGMDQARTKHGPRTDQGRTKHGRNMDQAWTKHGPSMAAANQQNIDCALAQNMEIGSQLPGRSKITLACMRVHSRRRKETVVTSMSPSRHRRHVSRLQGQVSGPLCKVRPALLFPSSSSSEEDRNNSDQHVP